MANTSYAQTSDKDSDWAFVDIRNEGKMTNDRRLQVAGWLLIVSAVLLGVSSVLRLLVLIWGSN